MVKKIGAVAALMVLLAMSSAFASPIPIRGIVEGFYGQPWTLADRMNLLEFSGRVGLNAYIYAPKDDPYHRDRWREPYPVDKLQELRELTRTAKANGVELIFAVSPGLDMPYSLTEKAATRRAMLEKLESVYGLGIRQFAIFFDDIKVKDGEAQADLVNWIDANFVHQYSDIKPLLTVPTEYFLSDMQKDGVTKDYTHSFAAHLNQDIMVLATGREVCPDGLTKEDVAELQHHYIGHKLSIWWNYPVNDYFPMKPALGPLDKMTAELPVEGFFMNPMDRVELSKLSLATGAAYAAEPTEYDEEKAWQKTIKQQYGRLAKEMILFAGEHQRLENSWAHIGRADAPELTAQYQALYAAVEAGDKKTIGKAAKELAKSLKKYLQAYDKLAKKLPEPVLKECQTNLQWQKECKEQDMAVLEKMQKPLCDYASLASEIKNHHQELESKYISKYFN